MSRSGDMWAIVPVKPFGLAKQRLAPALPPRLRSALAEAMLADVLDVLAGTPGLAGTVVASADPDAARLARARGAEVCAEPEPGGLNAAVAAAMRGLAGRGRGGALVIAADVPGVTAAEMAALLDAHRRGCGLTIVPARDGGTNAIAMSPPELMAVSFGGNSFVRHVRRARAAGLVPRVLRLPGIALDLDRPEDVTLFRRTPSATRTWRLLAGAGLPPYGHSGQPPSEVTAHVR